MWILLKFDYENFGVSNLCFSKVIEEKALRVGSTSPPLGTGKVKCEPLCVNVLIKQT